MADFMDRKKTYDFIVDHFSEKRIMDRYTWLYDLMQSYLEAEKLQNDVYISEDILNHIIIDYFVDIYRLKEFQDIEKVHDSKIYAYLIFWTLRHKPLQIKRENAEKFVFVNEMFSAELLKSYLYSELKNVSLVKKEDIDNFNETLLYYFKYRDYSAKSIEILILAFFAGRGYQYSIDHAE